MNIKSLSVDLSKVQDLDGFYSELSSIFGFPSFFGKNINALVDCLASLRYPMDEMTNIHLSSTEYLLLEVRGLASVDQIIKDTLLTSIEYTNLKSREKDGEAVILLLLNR